MKLTVVIPCYNESDAIPLLLKRFQMVIKNDDIGLLLVNNGSTDDSQKTIEKCLPDYPFSRSITIEVNKGYGFGIVAGLRAAGTEYLAWTHADMQTDPKDVVAALRIIEKSENPQKTFVKGNRVNRGMIDSFLTGGMSLFETVYLGCWMNDINAQPNLFHRSFFESWENPPDDFSLDLYAYYAASKQALRMIRFPVLFADRIFGVSHWNIGWKSKINFIGRTVSYSRKLKRRLKR